MKAWRIVKMRHQHTAFDGEGARRYGGRFNVRGQRAVYASERLSLAALETLVHTGTEERHLRYVKVEIDIPETDTLTISLADLPESWHMEPPAPEMQQWGGDLLVRHGVLRVPSVLSPGEFNIVMSPAHGAFKRLRIARPKPFHWDPRLRF